MQPGRVNVQLQSMANEESVVGGSFTSESMKQAGGA